MTEMYGSFQRKTIWVDYQHPLPYIPRMSDTRGYKMKQFSSFLIITLFLAIPLQAQWQWLNPLPEGNEFYDATFIDDNTGWIIGGNGSMLKTTDGGMTWESQGNILRTTPFLGLSVTFTDAFNGLISMNNGLMLRTDDGGATWDLLPRTAMVLQKVREAPDGSLWGIGSLGAIARSTDGGLTWSPFATGLTTVIFDIAFPDAATAVAVCGGGITIRSTDNGQTWTQNSTTLGTDFASVSFRNAMDGFAIQRPKYLLRTTDGGQSWSDTLFTVNELLQVRFVDEQTGWLVSNSPGSVYKTTNGGMSWDFVAVEQPRRYTFYAIYPSDADNAILLGTGGAVFVTSDGGQNWAQRGEAFTRQHLHGVSALSDSAAWVFGVKSAWYTDDRGATWQGSDTISLPGFRSGYALNETRIIGTGSQGQVMLSTDAGQSWNTQVLSAQGQVEEIVFVDAMNGWLAGAHGMLARTTDAGASWQELTAGVTHDFNGIAAISALEAWTAGNGGVIFHTTDGGANWNEQTTPITTHLQSIEFVSTTEGWAGGQLALLHTTDGGATWTEEKGLAGLDVIYDINFTDPQHGYFMLSRAVARTSDGGTTFYRTDYPALGLQDLDATTSGTLWLAGRFGVMQRYTPAAAVVLQPDLLDFGDVSIDKQHELSFTVFNRGEIDLVFNNVATVGPGFIFVAGDLSPLPPGSSREITVAFAPKDTGAAFGTATVFSNAELGIPFIDLRGNGVPRGTSAFIHAPDTLDFGTLLLGNFSSKFVWLKNRGTQPLLITREVMQGGDSAMFQVTTESSFFFSADKEDSIQVTFAPLRPGTFSSHLLVESNDPVEPMYRIPVRGTGITPIIASDGVDFSWVLLDSSTSRDMIVKNIGSAPLHITSWMLAGVHASEFSFLDPGVVTLEAGDSIGVTVTFSPVTEGLKSAEIRISSDDLVNGVFPALLKGNGTLTSAGTLPLAAAMTLYQNYPNPVSLGTGTQTSYRVSLTREAEISLVLYDQLGRRMRSLYEGGLNAGMHTLRVNLSSLPAGIYHAVLRWQNAPGRFEQARVATVITD